jgi:hypothetical protein
MNERETPAAAWPTYALRAWLTALLGQTQRNRIEVDARIEHNEKEIVRLRKQKERSAVVIESLRESIAIVDSVLRRTRDVNIPEKETEGAREMDPHHKEMGHAQGGPKENQQEAPKPPVAQGERPRR